MTHTDIIKDADAFFEIDPITRVITNKTPDKTKVMQYDHNSERFTFSLPQYIEGHNMLNCNKIEVHYININTNTKEETRGLYEVNDVQAHPDDAERIIFSWLLSQNVTRDAGVVNFIIRFSCVAEDGVIEYAWSSEVFKAISVSAGIYNADVIVELYADVLEQWKQELFAASAEGVENINTAKETAIAEIEETASTLTSLSNALKGTAFGQSVTITDISPVEHNVDVSVQSKNLVTFKLIGGSAMQQGTVVSNTGDEIVVKGNEGNAYAYSSGWYYVYKQAYTGLIALTKDTVTVSVEVTLVEEGIQGAGFRIGVANKDVQTFTATTTPTRFSVTTSTASLQEGLYIAVNANTLKIANVQFEYGEVATDYTPYVEDVSGVSVSKYGANLLPYPYTGGKVENGITFTDNGDGTITANGTATNDSYFRLHTEYELKKGVSYQLKGCPSGGAFSSYNIYAQSNTDNSTSMKDIGEGATFEGKGETNRIIIRIANGTTVNNMTFKPQLSAGNAEYEPYKEPTTYTVNADGNVEGATSLYPTTTLMTDTEGVIVDAEYNKDINKAFVELEEKLTNAIISLGGNV